MMRTRITVAVLLGGWVGSAAALDYWVKNGGSNAADGLSVATAWSTLGHAADQVAPGDTVHVLDGSYQGFYLETSGTAGSPITFVAEGASVAITSDNPTTPDGINLEGASYVVIDGFVVDGRTRAGIRTVLASHVTIRNCRAGYNGRWGILTGFVDDVVIEDNETHHAVLEHGIYVSNSGDRPIIRRNHSHDNHANGIHMNGDASLGGDGTISDALVERNRIHGNGVGGGSGINMDGVVSSVVQNNLLYDNHASGISLYQIDGGSGSNGNLVVANTIVNAADARWCINIRDGSTGNTVVDNILYNAHPFRGVISVDAASLSGFVSDYNSLMHRMTADEGSTILDLADWQALGYDAHSFVATPVDHFVIPGSDFHLLPTSPAIDAGTAAGAPSDDLAGNPRPMGAGVDLGAYEVQLLECGDGGLDPGEECEVDLDCGAGEVCVACGCVVLPVCASGLTITTPKLTLIEATDLVRLRGDATIPEPWMGVDPPANGVRLIVDSPLGVGGFDALLPGGGAWTANATGTKWTYRDAAGSVAGITKAVVQDRSASTPGWLRWIVRGAGGGFALPPVSAVRTTVVLGAPLECATSTFAPPGGVRPRCDGGATKMKCR